jgi:lysophospholipid acyltransferase (LPLAT)-like uncharacterized protein
MKPLRRLGTVPWVQKSVGVLAAEYLRLVWKTNSFAIDPPDFYSRLAPDLPVIVAVWHGQHFMVPFIRREEHRAKVLISRHRDGEMNAIAIQRLGVEAIRASGTSGTDFHRKGGVSGFKAMLEALQQGYSMVLTADIPKVSRIAGRGIIHLARASGRPIIPVAVATSRRIQLDNWDRSAINLPLGRIAGAAAEPVRVPSDADDAAVENLRRTVEDRLNTATERVYAIVDGRATDFDWASAERAARASA